MRTGLLAALASLLLFSTGCMRNAQINQQLLERELRLEEDCIWRLRWTLEDREQQLANAQQQIDALKKEADVLRGGGGNAAPEVTFPPSGGSSGGSAPRLPAAPGAPSVEPGVEVPSTLNDTRGENSDSTANRADADGPALTQAQLLTTEPQDKSPPERLNPDIEVERIVLNTDLTGCIDGDGTPGSELLRVAIELRDAGDFRVLAPGDVSIVVIDPALEGRASRIARWEFEAEDVSRHVRRGREGSSLQFKLPWPTTPAHNDLRLFVRFTTYDGRRLEANLPIELQLAGSRANNQDRSLSRSKSAGGETVRASSYELSSDTPSKPNNQRSGNFARRPREWSPYR